MNILIFTNSDKGLYNFRKELIKQLISLGHDIYISCPNGKMIKQIKKMGCNFIESHVDRRGINPIKDIKLFCEYMRILRKVKPDMVITYTIKPNIYGCLACRLKGVEAYANVTGLGTAFQNDGMLIKLVTTMYKISFKKVKKVFFENVENRNTIVNRNIVKKDKTCCLNGAGVNLDEYIFSEYPDDGEIKFLFMGRVMKEKGVEELFQSAKRLKKDGYKFSLDVLGGFEDHYETKVKELDNAGVIKYWGYQDDVKSFIRKSHCFVLPSYHEGMANTLLESGAMGRPLITSNIHGCLEAVDDGKTGYLCNVKDANDLYNKMKQFLELPYEEKKKMGQASHDYIAARFDKNKVVEKTIGEIMG